MEKKILIVDDDIMQLMLMRKLLENAGFVCLSSNGADAALKVLELDHPDLIISDIEMPEKDGFVFRQELLLNEGLREVPFLFLTSHNDDSVVQKGLDLKAIDFIPKNIPHTQLIGKINNILSTVEEQKEKSVIELKHIADKLNLKNVPSKGLKLKNFEINLFHKTIQDHPGGDFIDFIKVDDRYTYLVLGDVMGKKWGAWFFSFTFLSYIRAAIRVCVFDGNLSVAQILQRINQVIHADEFLEDIYSTLTLLLIDDETGTITYSGASDLPLLLFKADEHEVRQIKSTGLLLGFFEDGMYVEQTLKLAPKDQLFILSDGAIDYEFNGVKKTDINFFAKQLQDLLNKNAKFKEITSQIFSKEKFQVDDCSLIQIKKF